VSAVEQTEAGFKIPGAAQQRVMGRIVQTDQHGCELSVDKHQASFTVLAGRQNRNRLETDLRTHQFQNGRNLARLQLAKNCGAGVRCAKG
jgi:hypothetical protein